MDEKPRLLVIGYKPPPYHGVIKMMQVVLRARLLKDKFEIDFLPLKIVKSAEDRGGFSFSNLYYNFLNIIRVFVICLIKRPRLVYLSLAHNNLGFLRDSVFILIAKLFFIKVCAHFHAGDFDRSFEIKPRLYKIYIKFILKNIDSLIVLANRIKGQFEPFISVDKINVLYNCIESDFATLDIVKRDNNLINILFIGYISKAKGAVTLAEAAKIVLEQTKKKVKFLFCGDFVDIDRNISYIKNPHGGYSEVLEIINNNNLEDDIELLGYVDKAEKKELLKSSHIFILPSYSEGFPISVLEAMTYALPLIVTPVGALGEVLRDHVNCLFVSIGNSEELAEKIIELIDNDSLRREMGEANLKLVRENYNIGKYEKNMLKILEEII